jgi:nucleotide-binding universal stress UspA family protein
MKDFERILAVSWMTKYCQNTIRYAASLAEKYGADLYVMHVIDTFWLQGWSLPMMSIPDEHKKDMERIEAKLDHIVGVETEKKMKVRIIVKEGDPVEEILKTIRQEKIDMAVMRANKEGRLEHFMVGSSNDKIIREMPCSIFLVR